MAQNFVLTTAGMAAATVAGTGGPKIDIVAFKLGAAAGYTPTAADTALNGATVFVGTPLSVTPHNGDTTDVLLQLGANEGPFSFGEIGIYLPGDVLFAKMAYSALQAKVSDAVNGVGSTWNIHALLKLADAPSLFNFTLSNNVTVPIVAGAAVVGPDAMGAGLNAIFALDVNGATPLNESPILLKRMSATEWAPEGYRHVGSITLSSVSGVNIEAPIFNANTILKNNGGQSAQYLIVDPVGGRIVPVFNASPTAGTAVLTRAAAWLDTVSAYKLYAYYPPELAPIINPVFRDGAFTDAPFALTGTNPELGFRGMPLSTTVAGSLTLTRAHRELLVPRNEANGGTVFPGGTFVSGDVINILNTDLTTPLTISQTGTTIAWLVNGVNLGTPTFTIPPNTLAQFVFLTDGLAYVSYAATNGGISGSVGTSGWTLLPNSLMLQWDTIVNAGVVAAAPVTFPVPFPVACFGVNVTFYTGALSDKSGNDNNDTFSSLTRFGCDLRSEGTAATHLFYFAVGH